MSEFPFDDFKETDFNEFERFFKTNTVNPIYDHRANFQTNSPSFYEYIAKHNHLMKILAKRIYDYDKELAKRFEEWDKRIENLPDELKRMFLEWIDDGTLARILEQLMLDEYATKEHVELLLKLKSHIIVSKNEPEHDDNLYWYEELSHPDINFGKCETNVVVSENEPSPENVWYELER